MSIFELNENKIKNFMQRIINFFGFRLTRYLSVAPIELDRITKHLTKNPEPIIFDVGASLGLFIEVYKKMFEKKTIHSFEPIASEAHVLKEKYKNEKNVFINNCAVGEKEGNVEFNITANSRMSSFKDLIPNTTWLKKFSKIAKVDDRNYITKKISTKVITLDDYAEKNNIKNIDILKIDTQGYEDKVLLGAKNLLKNNRIKVIQLEIIFSEIYENPLQIYDVEKILIPNNYKLFGIENNGSLMSNYIFQTDLIYVSLDTYERYKSNSPYFNN